MHTLLQDIRYAIRQLMKAPGFTATAVISLALGIGATTAVFSVVWAILMNPYPYAAPDRMVHFALGEVTASGYESFGVTATQWKEVEKLPAIEDSALINGRRMTMVEEGLPEDVRVADMSPNAAGFFGVPALLGRMIQPSDAVEGHDPEPVVVLGYKFWQRRFQGDPGIVGKTIQLDHGRYTVVGVAAKRFTWEDGDVYLPLKTTAGPENFELEARLRPGVSHAVAEQQMQTLVTQFEKETPKNFPLKPGPLRVIGLNEQFLKAIGPSLAMLFGAVLLLLAIGCGNVSILLLARGTARQHEFAVRSAIGASRGRIVRQLLTEALVLSLTGAALGVLLAYRMLAGIVSLLPENAIPHEVAIQINLPVLLFSVAVALTTGIFFGLWPALRLSRPDVREAMQAGTRKVAGTVSGRTLNNALIAGQIALTLVLLSTAGAAIAGFMKLANMKLGFEPRGVMAVSVPVKDTTYATLKQRQPYAELLRTKIAEIPGVRAVAVGNAATPPNGGVQTPIEILGQPSSAEQPGRLNFVSENFFSVLKIPVVQGRIWTAAENHNAALVAVISESLARKYFPKGDAVGHSIAAVAFKDPPPFVKTAPGAGGWMQIIGVVGDKVNDGLEKPVIPEMFVPYTMGMWANTTFMVATDGPPDASLHTIGKVVASVDHDQQVSQYSFPLQYLIETQPEYAQGQLISWLFAAFAVLALLLAAVGLYSVVAYTVAQRTNEFGIRMALGAPRSNVLGLVVRSTILSVGSGVAIGLVLTIALQKTLAHFATGSAESIAPLGAAMVLLAAVAVAASGIPARRATRIEPMEALRYE
jgi:putative ABC transport system permease protein